MDLAGLELVYATASGSTVTRKATWTASTELAAGQRLLVANGSGSHAPVADTTYSGGFAATGGALALRIVGGAVVDSIGWGDATSGFVEEAAAGAPPAGSSLERRPGGTDGNAIDTNDNASDWLVQGSPSPQALSSSPLPAASSTRAEPAECDARTDADPDASPALAEPAPAPRRRPRRLPPRRRPRRRRRATATRRRRRPPTPDAHRPTPTPSPTPAATPTPAPTPMPIASVRALPDATTVTIEGVLTTDLGALESGRGGFVQDASGGIAVYLDATASGSWPAGTTVVLRGSISNRFSQRTLRLAEAAIDRGLLGSLPAAASIASGDAVEPWEGARVSIAGTISGSPDTLADGIGITLDDGSGPIRAVIGTEALAGQTIVSGMTALVSGPLGQRDSSGTGSAGYRMHATLSGELVLVEPTPTPTPTPKQARRRTATPLKPSATTPGSTSTPSGSPTPGRHADLAILRAMALGAEVRVAAVVTAENGRLGTPGLIAVGDDTGGIAVRLPRGIDGFPRGTLLRVTGTLAAPYGQLEIRAAADGVRAIGSQLLPAPIELGPSGLDDTVEGRLVTVTGFVSAKPGRSSGGDLTIVLDRPGAPSLKVVADASSQITAGAFTVGATYRVVGVVGQRATRKGALDGYRICPRDSADVVALVGVGAPGTGPGSAGSPRAGGDRPAPQGP